MSKLKIDLSACINPNFSTGLRKLGLIRLQSQKITSRLVDCLKVISTKQTKYTETHKLISEKWGTKTDDGALILKGEENKARFSEELGSLLSEKVTLPIFEKFKLPANYEKLFPESVEPFNAMEIWALEPLVEFPFEEEPEEKTHE